MTRRLMWLVPNRRNRLIAEAVMELSFVRVLRMWFSFARLSRDFGSPDAESQLEIESKNQKIAKDVGAAIGAAVRNLPFTCNCLTQAICALRMLKRRGLSCTIYFGVTSGDFRIKEAHAWIRCGEQIITGGGGLERYPIIFRFSNQ